MSASARVGWGGVIKCGWILVVFWRQSCRSADKHPLYTVMEREGSRALHQPIHWSARQLPAPRMAAGGGAPGLHVGLVGASWPDTGCWKSRWRPLTSGGKCGLKIDTGLVGRWRVSAESVAPGAEGPAGSSRRIVTWGPELALGWRTRSGEESCGAAKARNWGKGHGKLKRL